MLLWLPNCNWGKFVFATNILSAVFFPRMISTESAVKCNNNNQAVVCLLYKKNLDILKLTKIFILKRMRKKKFINLITPKQLTPKLNWSLFPLLRIFTLRCTVCWLTPTLRTLMKSKWKNYMIFLYFVCRQNSKCLLNWYYIYVN